MENREATIIRETAETGIKIQLNPDGSGQYKINTGIGFFDHMLEGFARHGLFDLEIECKGDLHVDTHHTVEDVGIVLGSAIRAAAGEKKGIKRFGSFLLPMDDALALCAIDLSGRPYYADNFKYTVERIGTLETETIREFFIAVSNNAMINLHLQKLAGENNHHIAEACFKAFGKALREALSPEPRLSDVWSTKGSLT